MITIMIDKDSKEVEASSPLEALEVLCLRPDSYLILRKNVPIPIDEPLGDGDVIRAVRVASGG
jgi:sulfur carrier protein ThiS